MQERGEGGGLVQEYLRPISHKPTYEKHEYANRDGASRTNKNNIQVFMHVPRIQCTLFSVSLHRFSNQNFDN